jgi:hypothetical protein
MPKEKESLSGAGAVTLRGKAPSLSVGGEIWKFQNNTGSKKATIPRRQSSKGLFCRMCRLEVVTIGIHEQYCDLSVENHNTARGSQLWVEAEHDGGLVVTGADDGKCSGPS